ncbi:hypothetical protein VZT92_023351 [Zoarces viviparus]|uniref:Ig-like domain-containing protein n=1 Tax=Zoarces viviparus TaxID=48416 RepID=A0AAW1E7C2_ZOAVI
MEAVIGLLVMLLGVSHGVETHCDGRQNGAQCYGPLGGTVVLQLMTKASATRRYQWLNKTTVILDVRKNKILSNLIENRSSFTPSDGTFRIDKLSRTDAGEYRLITFDSDGNQLENRTLQLTIQAPVSSVLLDSECLSQGEMKVSCSSQGADSPQYSWTLDDHALTDSELLSANTETNSITLKQHVSGKLVCLVKNKVSRVLKELEKSNCGFIFINCTTLNGTHISQWVFAANNTLCIEPTTAPTTTTATSPAGKESGITVSINPNNNITSSNNTVTHPPSEDSWDFIQRGLLITAGVLAALVLLLVVGVAVVCSQKKKKKNKPKEEDDQELTYADVKIMQRPGRQMQQRAGPEVEYGEVVFSERPRQAARPAEDECVYAKVRKGR